VKLGWLARLAILIAIMGALGAATYFGFQALISPWGAGGDGASFPSSPLATPAQIVPDWYLLPAFSVLRAVTWDLGFIDPKSLGLLVLCAAFVAPLTLAFFDWSKTPTRVWLSLLSVPAIVLGLVWAGAQSPMEPLIIPISQILVLLYFLEFLVVFPLMARTRARETASAVFQ
jgi:quinol-cytochrome oxidoreductase complex cytochrome b subunit